MSTETVATPDLAAIKTKQQATWATGNYAMIGSSLQIVGETLCEAVDLRGGWRVLDVAAGNGNASLAAARRRCQVTSSDYVPALLERGKVRAEAEGFSITFKEADAENLPFGDDEFDAVLSTFGVMFTPNQAQSASEMFRVVKSGGKIGLANWTPASFVGRIFKTIGKYVPPPAGLKPPSLWGTEERLRELFPLAAKVQTKKLHYNFCDVSAQNWLEVFRTYYGPMNKTFAALDEAGKVTLTADLMALMGSMNVSGDSTLLLPSEYLEVVITK